MFSGVSHVAEQTGMLLHVDQSTQFTVEMMNPAQQAISEHVMISQNMVRTLGIISLFLVWLLDLAKKKNCLAGTRRYFKL